MRASANHDKWAHICNEIHPAGTDGEDDDGAEEERGGSTPDGSSPDALLQLVVDKCPKEFVDAIEVQHSGQRTYRTIKFIAGANITKNPKSGKPRVQMPLHAIYKECRVAHPCKQQSRYCGIDA
jgi:hypothetical protein